jgi:hypothetical protein
LEATGSFPWGFTYKSNNTPWLVPCDFNTYLLWNIHTNPPWISLSISVWFQYIFAMTYTHKSSLYPSVYSLVVSIHICYEIYTQTSLDLLNCLFPYDFNTCLLGNITQGLLGSPCLFPYDFNTYLDHLLNVFVFKSNQI